MALFSAGFVADGRPKSLDLPHCRMQCDPGEENLVLITAALLQLRVDQSPLESSLNADNSLNPKDPDSASLGGSQGFVFL